MHIPIYRLIYDKTYLIIPPPSLPIKLGLTHGPLYRPNSRAYLLTSCTEFQLLSIEHSVQYNYILIRVNYMLIKNLLRIKE